MKKVLLLAAALVGLAASAAAARAQAPAASLREVKGQVLTSKQMPAVRLKFGGAFRYVGGHEFILYNVARAEQHFFADADREGRVRRLYWVQFEGYLPDNKHAYDYKGSKTVNLGGLDFVADAYARNIKASPGRPDSDASRARAFLEGKGLRMGSDDVLMQRLVHLIDREKRNELMIIYIEDMRLMGLKAADVEEGGRAAGRWQEISAGLLERARKNLKVSR